MEDLRKLKDEATKAFTKGKFPKAAELWEAVCSGDPKDLQAKIKLGDALAKAGNKAQAVKTYQNVAEAYATEGFLPKAIAVCKVLLEVDPSHSATQKILADLYAKKLGFPSATRPTADSKVAPVAAVVPAASNHPPAAPSSGEGDFELDKADHAGGLDGSQQGQPPPMGREISAPEAPHDPPPELAHPAHRSSSRAIVPPPPPPPEPAPQPAAPPAPPAVALPPLRPASRVDLPLALSIEPSPKLMERHGVGISPLDELDPPEDGEEPPLIAPQASPVPPGPSPVARPPTAELEWATAPDDSIGASLESTLQGPSPGAQLPAELAELDFGEVLPGAELAGPSDGWQKVGEPADVELSFEVPLAGSTEEEIEILSITAEVPSPAAQPARALPRIPLFSDLAPEAFVELMEKCGFVRAEAGKRLIEEGSPGNSFFVVCSGKMRVVKGTGGAELTMAYLAEGAFFGELALLAGTPRAATVIAEEDSELLELAAPVLNDLARRYPHVAASLKQFGRQRLLSNVMATSALFRPFDRPDRKKLAELFKVREFMAGERVVEEGKPTDGLYLVMAGEMEVTRRMRKGPMILATLKEGDIFGEMSLLSKKAASADVAARRRSTVLRLPRDRFEELIVTYPQVLVLLSELADSRTRSDAKVMASVLPSDAAQPAV